MSPSRSVIAFIQPFGICGRGGGSRILRGLLDCDHAPAISITTVPAEIATPTPVPEFYLPLRPRFGRLERTRFAGKLTRLDPYCRKRFEKRLAQLVQREGVKAIHLIPHGYELLSVTNVARQLGLPLFLSIHDDIDYVSKHHPGLAAMHAGMALAWQHAAGIFTISEEIGAEYNRRYGKREFVTVTDGLKNYAAQPQPRPLNSLRVYFMGLHHHSYIPNFRALLDALKVIRAQLPGSTVTLTMRCGKFLGERHSDDVPITILPFASESEVERDMESADLLYMPLPFAPQAAAFGKFSLSTKLVTYLGSGLPILYHGPANTAACELLSKTRAAITNTTDEPTMMAQQILDSFARRDQIVNAALKLAHERFDLAEQQRRFWTPMKSLPR